MKNILKILTLTGLTASLSLTGLAVKENNKEVRNIQPITHHSMFFNKFNNKIAVESDKAQNDIVTSKQKNSSIPESKENNNPKTNNIDTLLNQPKTLDNTIQTKDITTKDSMTDKNSSTETNLIKNGNTQTTSTASDSTSPNETTDSIKNTSNLDISNTDNNKPITEASETTDVNDKNLTTNLTNSTISAENTVNSIDNKGNTKNLTQNEVSSSDTENSSDNENDTNKTSTNGTTNEKVTDNTTLENNYNEMLKEFETVKTKLGESLEIMTAKLSTFDENTQFSDTEKETLTQILNTINDLSDDLEETGEKSICLINGNCEIPNLTDEEVNNIFMSAISRLENKLLTLENALMNIENLNSRIMPRYTFYQNPYQNIYGYYYRYSPDLEIEEEANTPDTLDYSEEDRLQDEENNQLNVTNIDENELKTRDIKGPDSLNKNPNTKSLENSNNTNNSNSSETTQQNSTKNNTNSKNNNKNSTKNITNNLNSTINNANNSTNAVKKQNNTNNNSSSNTNNNINQNNNLAAAQSRNSNNSIEDTNTQTYNPNKKKFGDINLASNIDTYGPKYRNIDTFFNTALVDENMMYNGYGYYGGYGMPYGNNFYGGNMAGYGMNNANWEYNSNNGYTNPNANLTAQTIDKDTDTTTPNAIENTPVEPEKASPKRVKFAKNIDTYHDETMKGNINTMNGTKITDFIKDKFNKWFRKDKQETKLDDNEVDKYVEDFIENPDGVVVENKNQTIEEKNTKTNEIENDSSAKSSSTLDSNNNMKNENLGDQPTINLASEKDEKNILNLEKQNKKIDSSKDNEIKDKKLNNNKDIKNSANINFSSEEFKMPKLKKVYEPELR